MEYQKGNHRRCHYGRPELAAFVISQPTLSADLVSPKKFVTNASFCKFLRRPTRRDLRMYIRSDAGLDIFCIYVNIPHDLCT